MTKPEDWETTKPEHWAAWGDLIDYADIHDYTWAEGDDE